MTVSIVILWFILSTLEVVLGGSVSMATATPPSASSTLENNNGTSSVSGTAYEYVTPSSIEEGKEASSGFGITRGLASQVHTFVSFVLFLLTNKCVANTNPSFTLLSQFNSNTTK